MIQCKKCKEKKSRICFSKNSSRKNGLQKYCKKCNKEYRNKNKNRIIEQKREYYRTEKGIAKQLFDKARYRAKNKSIAIDIDYGWVLGQVETVKMCPVRKVCFVTGNGKFHNNSRTLDRIDNNIGYTMNNTILISFKANLVKNNGTIEDIEILVKYLKNINAMHGKTWKQKFNILNLTSQLILTDSKKISKSIIYDARRRAKRKNIICSIKHTDIVIPDRCPIYNIYLRKGNGKKK